MPGLNPHLPSPPTSSHANVPYTPRSSSIADDSDVEFDPTPIHSPGGPQYDDLPPSYDEAQHQAVTDARNGVAALDPSQLEAHRLTLNEGPNEPEIWEYRVRGEQVEPASEHEQAPEYEGHVNNLNPTVPIQHVERSSDIPVGRVGSRHASSTSVSDSTTALLNRALDFIRHEPDADVQYAPRLTRVIAIPQRGPPVRSRGYEKLQFLRAYAKALHTHSIRPAEFTEFLDGLNTLCTATKTTNDDLLRESSPIEGSSGLVCEYIRGANEAFFAPRGLRVSLQTLSNLLEALNVPTERGQRAGAVASVLDRSSTPTRRAQALYPWIEALETNVPEPSTHALVLRESGDRIRSQIHSQSSSSKTATNNSASDEARGQTYPEPHADPPHSIPEPAEHTDQPFSSWGPGRRGFGGRGCRRGGPWSPFGAPGNGPFGAPGNGPFVRSNRASLSSPGFGLGSPPHYGRGHTHSRSNEPSSSQYANDWAAWGGNLGRFGEEFGKRMGDWGEQFGRRAEAWGQDVGRRAEIWGEEVSAKASGSGTQSQTGPGPADDPPPSYPEGSMGQETGVLRRPSKADTSNTASMQNKSKKKANEMGNDNDDDASLFSSDTSDSDSDSDSDDDDENYPDTEAVFLKRIHSINEQADLSVNKGKKTPEEVATERALAIEKAQDEKTSMDLKIEEKQTKRAIKLSLRRKGRELKKAHRQRKREMRKNYAGKGKGKAKKTKEWRDAKREYREKKRELRKEKLAARKEWREAKYDRKKMTREGSVSEDDLKDARDGMVWVIVENLTMGLEDEFVQVDEMEIGLDRSKINSEGQIQLPELGNSQRHDNGPRQNPSKHVELEQPESRSSTQQIKVSIKQKKHDAGIKIRKTLHLSKASDELETSSSPVLANTAEETSDSRLNKISPIPEKHTMKDLMHNPVDTIKSKVSNQGNHEVAANIAAKEISHGQEVDLLNASTAVEHASTENEKLLATQTLAELMKERQSAYVRWTLDRHVTKIRVLPRDTVVQKPKKAFEKKNIRGGVFMDWRAYGKHLLDYYAHRYGGQYIGYGSDPPTPSKETIMPNVERLIVASSPFQELAMTTRRIYRWDNPSETIKYLLIYFTLWFLNLLLPGILSAIMYFVIERHVHGNSLDDLRQDIQHREDVQKTALSITELIEKEGDEEWTDKLLEGVGPWAMVQLADAANLLESVRNFYEWRKPTRTKAVLGVLGVTIVVTAVIPIWLLVKSATLGIGIAFFGLFPIAVNFPEYRLLVSPSKRFLWNIPTHAEWAIQYIQAEGTRVETSAKPSPSALPIKTDSSSAQAQDYGFYKGHHDKSSGHLVMSTSSVRFVSGHPHTVQFTLPYDQINNIEKVDRIVAKNMPEKMRRDSGKDLKLVDKAGMEWVLKDVDQRDEAFSQIVGFSKSTWQVVW
ncbi:uncharacterized protein K460DRAFT_303543 [Cucurbitaria berberidis CBS 394.84]|uniref:Uncharacterized protein n=1 Tax=Cucurbitaria berberidis CBS 394.84 TaxID=1168544 RepID=A0A9P4LD15_9PLEO|nr:uncharacterized protein K460DRAFT_303543 [Cucurbitaria berberidis CBS 394.84]KAF1851376.1 hypothetical protein K460DRAFT_303543 [Cucurbitaria berberidis CBS 394.84]